MILTEAFEKELAGYELKGSRSTIDRTSWEPLFSYLELRDLADNETFSEKAPVIGPAGVAPDMSL